MLKPSFVAVVMAGGKGRRLRPWTQHIPKPLMPVRNVPILGRILRSLRRAGFRQVYVSVHYRAAKIMRHVADGRRFGLKVTYLRESRPLGTAGCLSQLAGQKSRVLVVNGDILSAIDFSALRRFHLRRKAALTAAVREHWSALPYGAVTVQNGRLRRFIEKPEEKFLISAGIYMLEPWVCGLVPKGRASHMPDLIRRLIRMRRHVAAYQFTEPWIDIGTPGTYRQANAGRFLQRRRAPRHL